MQQIQGMIRQVKKKTAIWWWEPDNDNVAVSQRKHINLKHKYAKDLVARCAGHYGEWSVIHKWRTNDDLSLKMTILLTQATVSTPEINEKLLYNKMFVHYITFQGLHPFHKISNLCK